MCLSFTLFIPLLKRTAAEPGGRDVLWQRTGTREDEEGGAQRVRDKPGE